MHGVVAPDRSEALHAVVRLTSAAAAGFGGVRLPGFDLARRYRLRVRGDFLRPTRADAVPAWWAAASAGGVELSGTVLADVGLQLPVLGVAQGVPPALDALTAQCRRQPTGTAPATSGSSVRSGSSASRRANR